MPLVGRAVSYEALNHSELGFQFSDQTVISQVKDAKPLTRERIRAIIAQTRDAWIKGDGDAFASLFAANGEFIVPGDRRVGPAAIRQIVRDFAAAYSNVKIDIRQIIIDGNQVVVEWHWQDQENATGTRSAADDAIVIDFKAGQIMRWREYIDTKTPDGQS